MFYNRIDFQRQRRILEISIMNQASLKKGLTMMQHLRNVALPVSAVTPAKDLPVGFHRRPTRTRKKIRSKEF